jgi:predicted nucleic acid-binding protein
VIALGTAGVVVIVPEIADYEIRRELIRAGKTAGVDRLNGFIGALQGRYLPITTPAIRLAADLWARSRNAGLTTADARALDADVILAAQALEAGWHESDFVVASVNVRHISRFVPCRSWTEIAPDG